MATFAVILDLEPFTTLQTQLFAPLKFTVAFSETPLKTVFQQQIIDKGINYKKLPLEKGFYVGKAPIGDVINAGTPILYISADPKFIDHRSNPVTLKCRAGLDSLGQRQCNMSAYLDDHTIFHIVFDVRGGVPPEAEWKSLYRAFQGYMEGLEIKSDTPQP